MNDKKTYVRVYGSWAWDHVRTKLGADGSSVTVVNLPGHGDDYTPTAGSLR